MTFTAKQVSDAIDEFYDTDEFYDADYEYAGGSMWAEFEYADKGPWTVPGLGEVSTESVSVPQGDGVDTYIVIRVGDQLFQKQGYYSSYNGNDWDGRLFEVEPYEETVTRYRRV